MEKIRWTIIGAGGIADRRAIPAMLESPVNEIVAVMDRVGSVAEAVAKKYSVSKWYDDAEKMLAECECDAVYIATPVFCHYEQAMLALKYDCHAFIEKPLAMNAIEAKKILDAYMKAKKQLTVGYMMSYHNLHKKARTILRNGGIGTLVGARFQFSCWYPDIPGAWRQNKALGGGGCIMDLAVHCMELYTRITDDKLEEVRSFYSTKTFNYKVEDSASILFKSKAGVIGHIDVNFNIPDAATESKVELYGTDGAIIIDGSLGQVEGGKMRYVYAPQGNYDSAQNTSSAKPRISKGQGKNIYAKQFADFNKTILNSKTNYKNAKLSVEIQEICDRIYGEH